MNVIQLLKKLGILHAGSESYKGKGQILGEFYGSEEDKKGPEQTQKESREGTSESVDEPVGEPGVESRTSGSHAGRKIFFWLSVVFGLLCVLIMFAASGATLWSLLTLLTWAGFSYYAGMYAFAARGRTGTAAGLFLGAIVLSFVFLAIASPEVETVTSLDTSTQSGLHYEETVWASMLSDSTLQPMGSNEFSQGEGAALVLRNVGGFKQGGDGLHRFDMDVTVEDADGNTLIRTDDILGDNGHLRLPDGIAESPYTLINTADLGPGQYQVQLTIYDRIGSGRARVNRALVVK